MLKFAGEYLDYGLGDLRQALQLIDLRLKEINARLGCGFNEGLAEQADYFIGFGFTAMQQYQDSVSSWVLPEVTDLLALGPCLPNGIYQAQLINAGANFWKHGSALWKNGFLPKTIDPILATVKMNLFGEYTLANILHALSPNGELLLANLLPALEQWRDAVLECNSRLYKVEMK